MILFIDDELRLMHSYKDYLQRKLAPEGCTVAFHSNVDEALDFFDSHLGEIRLVILDIMMPTGARFSRSRSNGGLMTGLLVYGWIRKAAPDLPILFFTNFSDDEEEKRLKQDRMCKFLHKGNYLLEEFVGEVRQMLAPS
jgi:CheY-like chemotaxis protein